MKTKTRVRAGILTTNHNETLVRDSAKGAQGEDPCKGGERSVDTPWETLIVGRKPCEGK